MKTPRKLVIRRLRSLNGTRSFVVAALVLVVAAITATACGGGDSSSDEFFTRSDEMIRRLVPDARSLKLRVFSTGLESEMGVDLKVSTLLDGEPRMHIVSDNDAIAGAELTGEYEGFDIYLKSATFWAELTADPPLYAGTPNEAGTQTYVDFYLSGEPELTDEQFWNAFEYARDRVGRVLAEPATLLIVDFEREWRPGAAGVRLEAILGKRQLSVAVLYAPENGPPDGEGFDEELVAAFKERFAVTDDALEESENPDWDYAHRIWFLDSAPDGEGE